MNEHKVLGVEEANTNKTKKRNRFYCYFGFSFHEIAVYDFPAMLKFVKNATHSRVTFIGYSAAGTAAFIFASRLKDVAKDTVDLFVTISPALTLGNLLTSLSPVIRVSVIGTLIFFLS